MRDSVKSKEQLADEATELRRRLADLQRRLGRLEAVESERVRAEEALAESEEKYRRLVEELNDVIYVLDEDGIVTYVSPSIESLIGYSPSKVMGRHFAEFIDPEDLARSREGFQCVLAGRVAAEEYRVLTRSGQVHWIRTSSQPVHAEGRVVGVRGVLTDVTERKRAEQKVLFQANLLQNVSDAVISTDPEFNILSWNKAAEDLYGWPAEQVVGKPLADVVPTEYPYVSREEVLRRFHRDGYFKGQVIQKRRDGTPLVVLSSVATLRDSGGNTVAVVGTNRDITERVRTEEALQKAHDELETRVEERTTDLVASNRHLQQEIAERAGVENALRQRAEELSTLNSLSRRVSASLSLEQVAETALEEAVGSIAPDVAMLYLRRGQELVLQGVRSADPRFQHTGREVHRTGQCLCGLASSEGRPYYSRDIHADPLCTLEECRQAGIRSFAALPLLSGDDVLGVLGLASVREQDFGERAAYLEALGGEIALGLRNALLYQEVQRHAAELEQQVLERVQAEETLLRRSHELALLNRSTQAFSSTLDTDQVLANVLEEVRRLLGVIACSVWLLDPEKGELVGRQATGFRSELVLGWRLALGEGIAGWVAQTGEPVIVADALSDERHFRDIDQRTGLALRSILTVPLQTKEKVIGVLQVLDERPGRFDAADLTLLELLASSAATALENARLYEELDRARRQWEEIFQAVGHPALILDAEHKIVAANRATVRATGRPESELLGLECYQVFHGDCQPGEGCPVQELLVSGRTETVEMEMEVLGGVFLVSCTPVFGHGGRLQRIIHIATDITDRKRAEEGLRRQNEELAILYAIATTISQELDLAHILDATLEKVLEIVRMDAGWVQVIDRDGDSLSLTAHRGVSQEAIQELSAIKLDQDWIGNVVRSSQPQVVTETLEKPEIGLQSLHKSVPYTWTGIPIPARETVLGVLSVLSHTPREMAVREMQLLAAIGHQIGMAVENMRLLEEASEAQLLKELDLLRSELVANASHELRTPLGLIRIFATALLMEQVDFDSETEQKFLSGIEDETRNLEAIVDNLLDLGRMEGGRLRLDKHPTDLGQLARKAVEDMEPQLVNHRLVHDFPGEPLMALADAERIEQVFRNLLGNAIKYSPQGGTITVRGRRDGEEVLVCVSDEGIGIPAEEQERIFERFYRVDNEVTRRARGAGLGLSICKWILDAHAGRICVQSAPGAGSTFCAILPVGDLELAAYPDGP